MTEYSVCPTGLVHGYIMPKFATYQLSLGARATYGALCDYARDKDHCWPSHKTLAAKLGKSVTSIKRYLRELVRVGLIMIESWAKRSCKYTFLFVDELKDAAARREQRSKSKSAGVAVKACSAASRKSAVLQSIRSPRPSAGMAARPADPSVPPVSAPTAPAPAASTAPAVASVSAAPSAADFEAFWAAYPVEKQVRRGAAIKIWRKLHKSGELPELSVLLAALEGFKASDSWEKDEGRWIPAPCRWLEDMRWLDASSVAYVAAVERRKAAEKQAAARKAEREVTASKVEAHEASRQAEREKALPLFEAFAARFPGEEINPWERSLWEHLYSKGMAPLAGDVPEDNALTIMKFLKAYERKTFEKAAAIAGGIRGLLTRICHDTKHETKEV